MIPYQGLNTTGPQAQQLLQALMLAQKRARLRPQTQGYTTPYSNQGVTTNAPSLSPQDAAAAAGPSATD